MRVRGQIAELLTQYSGAVRLFAVSNANSISSFLCVGLHQLTYSGWTMVTIRLRLTGSLRISSHSVSNALFQTLNLMSAWCLSVQVASTILTLFGLSEKAELYKTMSFCSTRSRTASHSFLPLVSLCFSLQFDSAAEKILSEHQMNAGTYFEVNPRIVPILFPEHSARLV